VQLQLSQEPVSLDPDAIDALIRDHGVPMVHWRGMVDPVGLVELHGGRRPDPPLAGAINGKVYSRGGTVVVLLSAAGAESEYGTPSILDAGQASATTRLLYNEGGHCYLSPGDRLEVSGPVLVSRSHLVEASPTLVDRLEFPAVEVQDVVDAAGRRYGPGDFQVTAQGDLAWTSGGPGVDPISGHGRVYAVRYIHHPFWIVERLIHEVRVTQVEVGETRQVVQLPQAAIVQREYVHRAAVRGREPAPRDAPEPADGGFTAR
jgi:hypothetical protein